MTTHQEALEAARAAYQSSIPDGSWHANGGETDAPILAAVTAYISTLAPADTSGLVERLRDRASRMNGALVGASDGGTYALGYYDQFCAKDDREAADAITAQAAENERLKANEIGTLEAAKVVRKVRAERDEFVRELRAAEARITALEALVDRAGEALEIYADPTGYTDTSGESLPADAETHPGLLALDTLTTIKEARNGHA